jgi:hypothetical protein
MLQGMLHKGRIAVLAAMVVGTGCASSGGPGRARSRQAAEAIRVVVENQNWMDMNVYVQTEAGLRLRVGSVTTGQTQVFVLRSVLAGGGQSLRFIADPVGSTGMSETPLLSMLPGAVAYWRIGNAPSTSSVQVR